MPFSLKETARAAIVSSMKYVTYGARRALIQGLAEGGRDNGFGLSQFAKAAGVSTFIASGEAGPIQSSSLDQVILPIYGATKTWASSTVEFIREAFAVANGGTYLDIGANIGLTTIPIAQDPKVRCIAFEPDATNFEHLSVNVARNCPHGNVELLQKAVMEKTGELSLGLSKDGNLGDHRVIRQSTTREVIKVEGVALDDIFGDVALPLVIKMDVQGAEPFVIAGGHATFARADAVVLEFSPYAMDKMGASPEEIFNLAPQFTTMRIAEGDCDESVPYNPDDGVETLCRYMHEWRHDHGRFWDVYLSR